MMLQLVSIGVLAFMICTFQTMLWGKGTQQGSKALLLNLWVVAPFKTSISKNYDDS